MSKSRRNYNDIKKEFTDYQLNLFSRKIALEYIAIRDGHPRSKLTLYYCLTNECYYKILEYAIVHCTVFEKEIEQMQNIALYNHRHNAIPDEARTKRKYDRMRQEREDYINACYEKCKDEKKKAIAEEYEQNEKLTVYEIAFKRNLPYKVVNMCIEDAIIQSLIDEHQVANIMWKEIRKTKFKHEVIQQFCEYKEKREAYSKETKS